MNTNQVECSDLIQKVDFVKAKKGKLLAERCGKENK